MRSSEWINEPTVPTTVEVATTTPSVVPVRRLTWANDRIQTESLEDQTALLSEVFSRRGGDRFIQASRREIAVALRGIAFPRRAPSGAEWVTSQLVFDNDGTLADDPSAAFGLWSAEPYTRSRSVAQMVVLRVSMDPDGSGGEATCERFAERNADECEIVKVRQRDTWLLRSSGNATLIWFDGDYRYEMFGRSFVPVRVLRNMSRDMVRLDSIGQESS